MELNNEVRVDLSRTFVFLINEDLHMSAGKIASQVAHVAMQLGCLNVDVDSKGYHPILGRAVVLYTSESLMKGMILEPTIKETYNIKYVLDAGKTEVPAHSLTCIGFIRRNNELIEYTKNLKSVK